MATEIQETTLALQRVLPPGMQPADGKAGVGISFAPDMEGYQIIQSMAPQGTAAACGKVRRQLPCERSCATTLACLPGRRHRRVLPAPLLCEDFLRFVWPCARLSLLVGR
jgi:hypothetical protein